MPMPRLVLAVKRMYSTGNALMPHSGVRSQWK